MTGATCFRRGTWLAPLLVLGLLALFDAPVATAQTTPSLPSTCFADSGATTTWFKAVTSTSNTITVTFLDTDPAPSASAKFTLCAPWDEDGTYRSKSPL